MSRIWQAVRPSVKLIAAFSAILSTAGLSLQQAGVWGPPDWVIIAMVADVAVVACAASGKALYWELRRPIDAQLRSDVAKLLQRAAREIADARSLDRDAIGVSAFEVRRRLTPPFHQQLDRIYRERVHSNPPESSVDWTKGKGVIGRCWSEHKTMFKDLKAIATAHGTCDQACFSTLGDDVTMGLTFAEFRTIIGKYSSVLAFPITHAGTFIGCIAVDLPLGEGTRTSLDHRTVKEIVGITAASVGNLLRPPS